MTHVPPPAYAALAAATQLLFRRRPSRVRAVAAATVAGSSFTLAGLAAREFDRHATTVDPVRPDRATALVTSGPYRVTRNPMYLALAGVLLAHALWRGRWAALTPLAGFVAVIDRTQIVAEERALSERFGASYAELRRNTPRWLSPRSLRRR